MPADHLNNIVFTFIFSAISITWLAFIIFIRKTMHAPNERREAVLLKMLRIMFFLGMYWYWKRDPEKESDPEEKEIKKYKMFLHVRFGMVLYSIIAVLIFLMGLLDIKGYIIWFQVFSLLIAPFVALNAFFFWFMYYLMKEVNYYDKRFSPDGTD